MSTRGREDYNKADQGWRLPRRAFLGTAGAVGAAALGGVLGSGRATAAAREPQARPAPLQAARGLVGATVLTAVYPTTGSRYGAARRFDNYAERPAAMTIQKWFFGEGQWPAKVPPEMARLSAAGCKFIVCFKPSRDQVGDPMLPTPDQRNLYKTCNMFLHHASGGQPAPIDFDVVLWQEPNVPHRHAFKSGADYRDYVAWYRPYVPSGLKVIYDCSGSAHPHRQKSYFPGRTLVDKVYCDFYGETYKTSIDNGILDPLSHIEQVADDNHLPFGLGEWGYGPPSDHLTPKTMPPAHQFVDYIAKVFTDRLSAGKVNGDVLYYSGNKSTANKITGPKDWRAHLFREIYDDLSSTT